MRKLCRWSKNAKIAMIERDLTMRELAKAIDRSPQFVSAVVTQRLKAPNSEKIISDFLNIEDDGKDVYD